MKKIIIVILYLTALITASIVTGFSLYGILSALVIGPINETYPIVMFCGITALLGGIAIIHIVKEMEVNSKEA